MYDAMPSPEQSAFGGTTWRDTLGPSGNVGGGGAGWNPGHPATRSTGGGGNGGPNGPTECDAINYTGSGGGVSDGSAAGAGGDGLVWIRYETTPSG